MFCNYDNNVSTLCGIDTALSWREVKYLFQFLYVAVVVFDNIVQDKAIYDCCVRELAQWWAG